MKRVRPIHFLFTLLFIFGNCTQKSDNRIQSTSKVPIDQIDLINAKQLVDSGCIVCHSATASEENRIAPPLEAVKRRYLAAFPKIEDFTEAVVHFVLEPSEENAIMYAAVERFDVMLPMTYSEEDLKAIATYIYEFKMEQPEWFEEHYQEEHGGNGKRKGGS